MAYSPIALQFAAIGAADQVRLSDRVSFLYLEYAQVVQGRTGVLALRADEDQRIRSEIQLPVGSIAVLMLGPGTSITQPAAASIAAAGACVMFTGGGGVHTHSTAKPLTTSSRWAEAQARLWASTPHRIVAARALYEARLGGNMVMPPSARLGTLRGLEGQMMKAEYRRLAIKHRISFRRDSNADDAVNTGLNLGNSILYGVASSVCSALSLNPALGIIHQGNVRALFYDLADVYKQGITLPIAFASAKEETPAAYVRRAVRAAISQRQVLHHMMALAMKILTPHLTPDQGDVLLDDVGTVAGHTNYANAAEDL
jgi:CRISPR-associated protein Cas1